MIINGLACKEICILDALWKREHLQKNHQSIFNSKWEIKKYKKRKNSYLCFIYEYKYPLQSITDVLMDRQSLKQQGQLCPIYGHPNKVKIISYSTLCLFCLFFHPDKKKYSKKHIICFKYCNLKLFSLIQYFILTGFGLYN